MAGLQIYCDASFASDYTDWGSTTGYVLFYYGVPIMWDSSKQKLMAMSTAEVEYIALAAATQLSQVIKTICLESGLKHDAPCTLKTDNMVV